MDTKSLSFTQVHWAQKLSCYHFWISYRQSKANKAANALSRYFQQSAEEEKTFRVENVKILHYWQFLLTNVNLSGLSTQAKLLPLHWAFIYSTHMLF